MSSLLFNKLKTLISPSTRPIINPNIILLPSEKPIIENGGPESSRLFGCSSCVINSQIAPDKPSSLINIKTPVISIITTPASITTQRRNDTVLSAPLVNTTERFINIVRPIIPPPDIIAFIPYRDSNEPTSRIPPCIGPKRINT